MSRGPNGRGMCRGEGEREGGEWEGGQRKRRHVVLERGRVTCLVWVRLFTGWWAIAVRMPGVGQVGSKVAGDGGGKIGNRR